MMQDSAKTAQTRINKGFAPGGLFGKVQQLHQFALSIR
jgi:hypothetical protein